MVGCCFFLWFGGEFCGLFLESHGGLGDELV